MAQSGGWQGLFGNLAGYYRDIEVAKASGTGQGAPNVRPESIADQTSMGREDETGPRFASVGGVEFDSRVLMFTGLFIGGLVAIRALR